MPRVAAEATRRWAQVALSGRAGYFFESSGARGRACCSTPIATCSPVGAGLTWRGRLTTLQLDGFVQWHHLQSNARVSGDFAAFGFTLGVDL